MKTPYAEQAEQARARLAEFEKPGADVSFSSLSLLKQHVRALDTLARVEAVFWSQKIGCDEYNKGWNECRDAVLKALEGEG